MNGQRDDRRARGLPEYQFHTVFAHILTAVSARRPAGASASLTWRAPVVWLGTRAPLCEPKDEMVVFAGKLTEAIRQLQDPLATEQRTA
jgi:hypothetical protein